MLAALHTKEAHSKQCKQKYDDLPNYKIGDLVMIRNFDKKSTWDAKYIPNFIVVHLRSSRQLEVSDVKSLNVCDVQKVLPSDYIVSSIADVEVFGRRDKYINAPHILKEVVIIDPFLHENFPHVRIKQKKGQVYPAHSNCT